MSEGTIVEVPDHWYRELCSWLRCRPSSAGPFVWSLLLVPRRIAPVSSERMLYPAYFRLEWTERAVPSSYRASVVAEDSRGGGWTEHHLRATGADDDHVLAELVVFAHTREPVPGSAHVTATDAGVPPMPDVVPASGASSTIFSEAEVSSFSSLIGVEQSVHNDQHLAWSSGFPNLVVQAGLLLRVLARTVEPPESGSLTAWFRGPIAAGSLVRVMTDGAGTWRLQRPGTDHPAAVFAFGDAVPGEAST